MFYDATPLIFSRAKELRNNLTPAEIKLWSYLRTKPYGCKFRRQHPIGPFIADFYCHTLKLVIEADGSVHNRDEVQQADKAKQWSLETENIQVLRFTNSAITNQFEEVIAIINTILTKEIPSNSPFRGQGGKNIILTTKSIPPSGG